MPTSASRQTQCRRRWAGASRLALGVDSVKRGFRSDAVESLGPGFRIFRVFSLGFGMTQELFKLEVLNRSTLLASDFFFFGTK